MFATLTQALNEHRVSENPEMLSLAIMKMEEDLAVAQRSDTVLKDIQALSNFSTLVRTSSDPSALIQLADIDGGLSTLFGVAATENLLTMAQEELADGAQSVAEGAESAEAGDEETAKKSNKKKWLVAAASAVAALGAAAAGLAAYKHVKLRNNDNVAKQINVELEQLKRFCNHTGGMTVTGPIDKDNTTFNPDAAAKASQYIAKIKERAADAAKDDSIPSWGKKVMSVQVRGAVSRAEKIANLLKKYEANSTREGAKASQANRDYFNKTREDMDRRTAAKK